jgi:hypothetical protein
MKIEKNYLKNYIVHTISILDLEMLNQLLRPIAITIKDKIEISGYLHNFEVIFKCELEELDTHFEVTHGEYNSSTYSEYVYTFTANHSKKNFSIKFIDSANGMLLIEECDSILNSNTLKNSGFNKNKVESPF